MFSNLLLAPIVKGPKTTEFRGFTLQYLLPLKRYTLLSPPVPVQWKAVSIFLTLWSAGNILIVVFVCTTFLAVKSNTHTVTPLKNKKVEFCQWVAASTVVTLSQAEDICPLATILFVCLSYSQKLKALKIKKLEGFEGTKSISSTG